MRATGPAMVVCAVAAAVLGAAAQDAGGGDRWVTFKVVADSYSGKLDHQIDRNSIRQEGPYKTFRTRIMVEQTHHPLTFSDRYEALVMSSQKFAVDCVGHKFRQDFLETNAPHPSSRPATLAKMRWTTLNKYPAVARAVCGLK